MKYPFMFVVGENENEKVVVKIASADLSPYNSTWMDDPDLGRYCWVPDVDLTHERYEFKTELEALQFIKAWWAKQVL